MGKSVSINRASTKQRLQREGRWDEFVVRRDELKAAGHRPADAYRNALAEFPPLEVTDGQASLGKSGGIPLRVPSSVFADKPEVSAAKVFKWVSDHICLEDVKPEDAPSATAWWLLTLARRDPNSEIEFMRIWGRQAQAAADGRDGFDDDGERAIGLIDRVAAAARDAEAEGCEGSEDTVLPSGAEGSESEPPVPEVDAAVGAIG